LNTLNENDKEATPEPKRKRYYLIDKVGVALFIIFPSICLVVCGMTAFLYPRLGGEWASLKVIPNPPQSETIMEDSIVSGMFNQKTTFYRMPMSLRDARNWFSQRIRMSPFDNDFTEPATSYKSLPLSYDKGNEYFLLVFSAALTISKSFWDDPADCFSVEIYTLPAFENTDYIDSYFSDDSGQDRLERIKQGDTIAVVQRCFPDG
jgi:hypothetical protein